MDIICTKFKYVGTLFAGFMSDVRNYMVDITLEYLGSKDLIASSYTYYRFIDGGIDWLYAVLFPGCMEILLY